MKAILRLPSAQSVIALAILILWINCANSQSLFDLNDSTIVFKDREGNRMSRDSVMSFASRGNFNITKKDIGGKTEITLYRESKAESEARAQ